ncbi:MAG: ribbon-helix-helix protein, CopG family [Gemmatimonadetes bacterium]|nr:ribbon-helix-helix protein, CopG family [Gemmatimonadota bacterium]
MKTAISLPDAIFDEAEQLARRLEVSRSELYRKALQEYLARHAPGRITQTLDQLCGDLDSRSSDFTAAAARRVFERTDW